MKKLILLAFLTAFTLTGFAQLTYPRFATTPNGDNTGRTLTYGYIAPLYSTPLAISANAYETTVKMGILTGAQTLTAVVTKCQVADKLSIMFQADGTDRIVTFSTGFASGGNITVLASTKMTVYFVFNGVGWFQLSGQNLVTGLSSDGTVSLPGIAFTSDPDNGFYRIGANHWAAAVGGSKVVDFSSTGLGITGNIITTTGNVRKNTSTAYTATGSVSAAQLAGGLLTITSGTDTLTLPTATLLATQLTATAGTIFEFSVLNIASGGTCLLAVNTGIVAASALTGGTSLSLANSATVGAATFRITFLSTTAATISRIN